MDRLTPLTRRVIASHGVAALAVALPWPLLLVLVDDRSNEPLLLGAVGAARMLPYVVFSWATARLADAMRRDLIVRVTLALRAVLLLVAAGAMVADHVWVAVAGCTLAVAVGTPAYPAQVAAMPGIAGSLRVRATDVLVTVEVAAFVVGAALGGLLLNPATRDVLPWAPAAMTLVALLMIFPVSMPAPTRIPGRPRRPSAYDALREAPAARRAIAVMAVVNFVVALVAVALLPLSRESWSSDAAGYGLATGVFGFAAFGAPLLRRLGRSTERSIVWGLLLFTLGLVLVVPVPTLGWSLVPLALAGAAAVSVEAGATAILQEHVCDEVRATVLGINDTVIIAAALAGSLVAPVAVQVAGGAPVLGSLAVLVLVVTWWVRPSRHQDRVTVVATRLETHAPAHPPVSLAPDRAAAHRAAVRRQRLLALQGRDAVGRIVRQRDERSFQAAAVRRPR